MFKSKILTIAIVSATVALSGGVATMTALSAAGVISLTNEELRYTCRFYNYDGALLYASKVEPTHNAVYRGNTPVKPEDELYMYQFTGWDKELSTIRKDTDFYAQFESKKRDFKVKFVNYDSTLLYEYYVQTGDTAHYPYATPTREADEGYSYVFKGWDEPLTNITKNTTFVAQYEKTTLNYKVYFFDYDETLLYVDTVPYKGTANYAGNKSLTGPEADEGYHYVFTGWSDSLEDIQEDKAVIALYELEINKYSVLYHDYDDSVIYTDEVQHGEASVFMGDKPFKPADGDNSYRFVGWDKDLECIVEDTHVYPIFEESEPDCTVVFKNYDGTFLEEHVVEFGDAAVYEGETPEREEEEGYFYIFVGWDRNIDKVTMSFDTIAQFEKVAKEFTITYVNYDYTDGKEPLYETTAYYGEDASDLYEGPTPIRPSDDHYYYEFIGWDEDLTFIKKDLIAVAQFEAHSIIIPPSEDDSGHGGSGSGEDGQGEGPGGGGGGGGGGLPPTTADVVFKNYDGVELCADGVLIGKTAHYRENYPLPTRGSDRKYHDYRFCSWDKSLENVTQSFVTYAQYEIYDDPLGVQYIVTFRNDNGGLLYECVCEENEMPSFPDTTPVSYLLGENGFFLGWDRPLVRATKSYTVYAKYELMHSGGGGSGGISGGIGFPDTSNPEDVGTITGNYDGAVYLREKSFGDKTCGSGGWNEATPYTTGDIEGLELTPNRIGNTSDKFPQYNIEVSFENYQANPSTPYYTLDDLDYINDVYLDKKAELVFDYNFAPAELTLENVNLLKLSSYTSNDYKVAEEAYRDYVYNHYLTLDNEYYNFFGQFVQDNNLTVAPASRTRDIIAIKDFIKGYAKYNLKGQQCPDDQDPIIFFLSESKEGVCNHFASALTLVYRRLGIPARFTCGYVTSASSEGPITFTTNNAHAWTEVYIDGIGWMAIDGTGTSDEGDTPDPSGGGEGGEGGEGDPTPVNPYNPFGPLTIDQPLFTITVSPEQAMKVYDGETMGVDVSIDHENWINEGDHLVYVVMEETADWGQHIARIAPRIYSSSNVDVTDQYKGKVSIVFEGYFIKKRSIEIETGSASKARDGEPLVCKTYTIINGTLADNQIINGVDFIVGSQTKVGTSSNYVDQSYFVIIDTVSGADTTKNYNIKWIYGTLTVN